MAVSFASGSLALANWGFSAGDIAALAGAGRVACNWLIAQSKDRSLLEFLALDVEDVIRRKGLLDLGALHVRWDQKLHLLKDGKMVTLQEMSGSKTPLIPNMDKFTWFMALIAAALDAALDSRLLRKILSEFLAKLFEESVIGEEYLHREAKYHIQGWLSVAFVRGITWKARAVWNNLATLRKHQPGFIPESDHGDLFRLLLWIATGESRAFHTSSSDTFCIAKVLEEIGVEVRTTEEASQRWDESQIVVCWSTDCRYPTAVSAKEQKKRHGMRVPLAFMEEVASLFPTDRNKMRGLFEDGMQAVRRDKIQLLPYCDEEPPSYEPRSAYDPYDDADVWYEIAFDSTDAVPHLHNLTNRLARVLLPIVTPAAARALDQIVSSLGDDVKYIVSHLAFDSREPALQSVGQHDDWNDSLSQLQVFLLGYYYELLRPLLNTSQMAEQEAFGSWGWYDMSCLEFIKTCRHGRHDRQKNGQKTATLYRRDMMKLAAYLFAGADLDQLQSVKLGALGIIGKLSLVWSTLLGAPANPEDFGKLFLLDIDPTCIPSSAAGIVYPGLQIAAKSAAPKCDKVDEVAGLLSGASFNEGSSEPAEDFTTHIEPDWEVDTQTCLIAYRHKGRIVHRLSPWLISVSLWNKFYEKNMRLNDRKRMEATATQARPSRGTPSPTQVRHVRLEEFYGGFVPMPDDAPNEVNSCTPLFIDTGGLANLRTCITLMYEGRFSGPHIQTISTQAELAEAVKAGKKVIIL